MSIILYQQAPKKENGFQVFLDTLRNSQLIYLASDILEKGLSPKDLTDAMKRAMIVCKAGGKRVEDHFLPIYSYYRGQMVNDCKLSNLGYALILMNARADNETVAEWQLEVLERAFSI